ncbi:MAG: SpoIID/LytB domain-containing protein [Deltaproteobacteria bacterium]|nr:SpoIID/LytB domain-containing protein [Deltaproteobacteria bacterium]
MQSFRKLALCLAVLSAGFGLPAVAGQGTAYRVRLLVGEGLPVVNVQAKGLRVFDGDVLDQLLPAQNAVLKVQAGKAGLRLPGVKHQPRSILLKSKGPVELLKRRLVGEVELRFEGKGILVINRMSLERYLAGLLGAEMSASWPLEALKAQAVAARSYFLHRRLRRENAKYDLATSTLDQVYRGIAREGASTRRAVAETQGQVLVYGHRPAEALFHACCGGRTRPSQEVFGTALPYLVAVEDPDCAACPKHRWRVKLSLAELGVRLARQGKSGGVAKVVSSGKGLSIQGKAGWRIQFSRQQLRRLVGAVAIPSSAFQLEQHGDMLILRGRGSGHGVGLCQWGAKGMAERGQDFKAILKRYYPGCVIRRLY